MSLTEKLVQENQEQSALFCSPNESGPRRRYRKHHPTRTCAFKCSDGRIRMHDFTRLPKGYFQPFRNIGGRFNLGWPYLHKVVGDWVRRNYFDDGFDCLALLTYHYSETDPPPPEDEIHDGEWHGCRGFGYNVEAARDHIRDLEQQIERTFGSQVLLPVMTGIETNTDRLIIHGKREDQILDLGEVTSVEPAELIHTLRLFHPDMTDRVARDILPMLTGNLEHIRYIEETRREITDNRHGEYIIAIGQGLDWLERLNTAMIVGPFDLDLASQILTAADIVWKNWKSGEIAEYGGMVLHTSAVYWDEAGYEKQLAIEKTWQLREFSYTLIKQHFPQEMLDRLEILSGIVNMNTRLMTPILVDPAA